MVPRKGSEPVSTMFTRAGQSGIGVLHGALHHLGLGQEAEGAQREQERRWVRMSVAWRSLVCVDGPKVAAPGARRQRVPGGGAIQPGMDRRNDRLDRPTNGRRTLGNVSPGPSDTSTFDSVGPPARMWAALPACRTFSVT